MYAYSVLDVASTVTLAVSDEMKPLLCKPVRRPADVLSNTASIPKTATYCYYKITAVQNVNSWQHPGLPFDYPPFCFSRSAPTTVPPCKGGVGYNPWARLSVSLPDFQSTSHLLPNARQETCSHSGPQSPRSSKLQSRGPQLHRRLEGV